MKLMVLSKIADKLRVLHCFNGVVCCDEVTSS